MSNPPPPPSIIDLRTALIALSCLSVLIHLIITYIRFHALSQQVN